ncbi:MAG: hypothetical protein QW451_00330 [Candidatus Aenigmatarchaeota archaeon]
MAKRDWKELLAEEDKEIIAQLLDVTRKHKGAFMEAEDVKVAQLWCALIEMRKQMIELEKLIGKVAEPFKAIVEIGEIEKRKTIERLVREILKPDTEHEEATKRLVDSLMKF